MCCRRPFVLLTAIVMTGALPLVAAEPSHESAPPRLVGELMLGTSGFEPGIAAEWRTGVPWHLIRPEVFINEDFRPGFAASAAWNMAFLHLPERFAITLGPRVVYHNSDRSGWEADAMAIWHLDLVPTQRGRHFLEVIGAIGALQDDRDDERETVVGASAGIAYAFQF